MQSISRAGDVTSGYLEGSLDLPVDGQWLVRFGFFVPDYSGAAAPDDIFPDESVGPVSETDTILVNLNGNTKLLRASTALMGHKEPVEIMVQGQQLRFRFDFSSARPVKQLHPFISPGEVTLIRDRNPPPPPGGPGRLAATARDAVDGNQLSLGAKVSNGYITGRWTVEDQVKISVFSGSTLVTQTAFTNGALDIEVPSGSYSCLVLMPEFYAYFQKSCVVQPSVTTYLGDVSLSPILSPDTTRAVLSWGATPKDLDTYVTVPAPDPARPPCLIWYKNKKCNSGLSSQVKLDLDSLSLIHI